MPIWLSYVPTIIGALVQLARLLVDLAKSNNKDEIKACSIALEEARRTGDTSKLEEIIKRMREGKPCD